jgi:hypothetical protein
MRAPEVFVNPFLSDTPELPQSAGLWYVRFGSPTRDDGMR